MLIRVLGILIFLFCNSLAIADSVEVKLKTGISVKGEIVELTDDHVVIDRGKNNPTRLTFKQLDEKSREVLKKLPKVVRKIEPLVAQQPMPPELPGNIPVTQTVETILPTPSVESASLPLVPANLSPESEAQRNANTYQAKSILQALFWALDTYKSVEGRYPDAMSALINANPPYFTKDYCGITDSGYVYSCKLSANDYLITATPEQNGVTGSTTFSLRPDGQVRESP